MVQSERTARTVVRAPYALAPGVPALQTEPSRVRNLVLLSVLLGLLGGVVTSYVCGLRAPPEVAGDG